MIELNLKEFGLESVDFCADLVSEESTSGDVLEDIYNKALPYYLAYLEDEENKENSEPYEYEEDEDDYDDYEERFDPDDIDDLQSIFYRIAGHINTPSNVLDDIIDRNFYPFATHEALQNESLNISNLKDRLEKLKSIKDGITQLAFNPKLQKKDIDVFIEFLRRFPTYLIADNTGVNLLGNKNITVGQIEELYSIVRQNESNRVGGYDRFYNTLANIKKTPVWILEELFKNPMLKSKYTLIKNPNFPEKYLDTLDIMDEEIMEGLVKRETLPDNMIAKLYPYMREYAFDKSLDPYSSKMLFVKMYLAHKNIPLSTLEEFSKCGKQGLLETIIYAKNCTDELRLKIYKENKNINSIIFNLLNSQRTQSSIIREIYKEADYIIFNGRVLMAQHKNTPPDILAELADYPADDVRKAVAGNPNLPVDKIIELTKDGHRDISFAAFKNESLPQDYKDKFVGVYKKDRAKSLKNYSKIPKIDYEENYSNNLKSKNNLDLELLKRLKSFLK